MLLLQPATSSLPLPLPLTIEHLRTVRSIHAHTLQHHGQRCLEGIQYRREVPPAQAYAEVLFHHNPICFVSDGKVLP
jgi:hypothetical protein